MSLGRVFGSDGLIAWSEAELDSVERGLCTLSMLIVSRFDFCGNDSQCDLEMCIFIHVYSSSLKILML